MSNITNVHSKYIYEWKRFISIGAGMTAGAAFMFLQSGVKMTYTSAIFRDKYICYFGY
jgi:hypothetical protein